MKKKEKDMQEKIDSLYENAKNEILKLSSSRELADVKVKYLGKTGEITSLLKGMKDIPPEKRADFGKLVNTLKERVSALLEERETALKKEEMEKSFEKDAVDITLDGKAVSFGNLHPLNIVLNKMIEAFTGMGFQVYEGPELELDYYCFAFS